MLLTRIAVERPIGTLMAVLAVCLGGILSFTRLPVDYMPMSEPPTVTIFVEVRGGMPPADIEHLITEPIEEAVGTMEGLKEIVSVARKDRTNITLTFDDDQDIKRASLDVSERLARIRGQLPREMEKPIVARYDENDHPVLILSATSSVKTPEVMRTLIERDLKPVLSRVPGVANIEIGGGRQRKILVEFDKSKLEMHRLAILDVIRQIGEGNLALTSGRFDLGRETWGVHIPGDFRTLDEMRDFGVALTKEGSRIRLRDVAIVRDYYLEAESHARVNSQPAVSIYVQKESGANTLRVAANALAAVRAYEKTLPSDMGIGVSTDLSVGIKAAIFEVRNALTVGAFLTSLMLWFFLRRVREVDVIIASIPVAVLGTFFAMLVHFLFTSRWTGTLPVTINVMSLLGIALGIGRMVDDSIVVFENILRRRETLLRSRTAGAVLKTGGAEHRAQVRDIAVQATREMVVPVVSSTVIMLVIFLPVVFISADLRRMFSDVAFTVAASLVASLLMAVTVVPLLASRIGGTEGRARQFWWERNAEAAVRRWFGWLRSGGLSLRGLMVWSIRNRFLVMGGVVASLAASIAIYTQLEKEFIGGTEAREFVIFVELPSGSKLDVSDRVVSAIEAEINSIPEVEKVVKTVQARVEGWSSKIYVTLNPGVGRVRTVQDVIDILRPRVTKIGGEFDAFVYFSEPQKTKEITVDVFGPDYLVLRDLSVEIAKRMQEISGLRDVKLRYKPGRPEVRLEVDHTRASFFGLSSKEIADTVHAKVRGLRATYFKTGREQVETVARLSEEDRRTTEQVANLTMIARLKEPVIVHMGQITNVTHGFTPSEVWRRDKERTIQVSANRERMALSTAVEAVRDELRGMPVPIGYWYEFGGDYKKLVKGEAEFLWVFIVMVFFVYMVLACFFESYTQPVLMLLTIPLAAAGSMPALWMTNTPVNMGVYIGLIMLGGTVVSNGIILIDRLNAVRAHRGLFRAVLKVGPERARPIFMTSLTTIAAMLPLVFSRGESSDMWVPLALTVVSGIALSSVLTIIAVPPAYVIWEAVMISWQRFLRGERGFFGALGDVFHTPTGGAKGGGR